MHFGSRFSEYYQILVEAFKCQVIAQLRFQILIGKFYLLCWNQELSMICN